MRSLLNWSLGPISFHSSFSFMIKIVRLVEIHLKMSERKKEGTKKQRNERANERTEQHNKFYLHDFLCIRLG